MQLLMVGAGGVGGYFGARLIDAGRKVTFVARGAHLEAIQRQGLRIKSPMGDLHLDQVDAVADPKMAPPPDLILIAVKLANTEEALQAIKPVIGPDTLLASLQNGIDAERILQETFGAERVLGGVARIAATIEAPGTISHTSAGFAAVELGELNKGASARLDPISEFFDVPGMSFIASKDIQRSIWGKFVFLATLSAATTTSRAGIGRIRDQAAGRAWLEELVREAASVAQAEGVDFSDRAVEATMKQLDNLPAAMTASMTYDLLQGKPLELDWLSGAVVRLAEKYGIDTPAHRHTVAALSPFRFGETR